jgi:REP element-mobilizing transposase RayT
LDKAKSCAFQADCYLIWVVKFRRKVLLGLVEVRFVEVLKLIAILCGFDLFTACVHGGDYVGVFVSVLSRIGISVMVCLFKCNSVKELFLEFLQLKLCLWGGLLWSEGYAVVLQVRFLA